LTFGVELFLLLFVRRGQSACAWQTVHEVRVQPSSSRVLRVLARIRFRSILVGRSFGRSAAEVRTVRGCLADGPRAPRRRSVFSGFASGGYVIFIGQSAAQAGQSAVPLWTVCGTLADSPHGPCGQSAPPGPAVRKSLVALLLGSIPPSLLLCFRVCFKESFLRLEVDP
jgi:hypothetical protein